MFPGNIEGEGKQNSRFKEFKVLLYLPTKNKHCEEIVCLTLAHGYLTSFQWFQGARLDHVESKVQVCFPREFVRYDPHVTY